MSQYEGKHSKFNRKEKDMRKEEENQTCGGVRGGSKSMSRNFNLKFCFSIYLFIQQILNAYYVRGAELDTRGDTKVIQINLFEEVMV